MRPLGSLQNATFVPTFIYIQPVSEREREKKKEPTKTSSLTRSEAKDDACPRSIHHLRSYTPTTIIRRQSRVEACHKAVLCRYNISLRPPETSRPSGLLYSRVYSLRAVLAYPEGLRLFFQLFFSILLDFSYSR